MSDQKIEKFKGYWIWPVIALSCSLVLIGQLVGLTGELGGPLVSTLSYHLGQESLFFAALITTFSALRDLKFSEASQRWVRWMSVPLMIVAVSALMSQIFSAQTFPISGGILGTYVAHSLAGSFGWFAPVLSLTVFSLGLVAWGGQAFQQQVKQGGLRILRVLTFKRSRDDSELLENSDESVMEEVLNEEELVEDSDEEEIEEDPDETPRFQRKPFDINELVKEKRKLKEKAKAKKKSKAEEKLKEEELAEEEVIENEDAGTVVSEDLEGPLPEEATPALTSGESEAETLSAKPPAQLSTRVKKKKKVKKKLPQIHRAPGEYSLPSLELLDHSEDEEASVEELKQINDSAKALQETLKNFGLDVQVVGIQQGPVITQYELELAPGIKVSRVMNLQNDIAMALRARSIRILAPIPGKATVGVEVPNARRHSVSLRELIEAGYVEAKGMDLPSFIGRNIFGEPVSFDVSRMPHLLMAGATGAGKSVGINCLILSLLMSRSPDEVKLVLVDPKQVELNFYKNIPHLVSPVVTDMKKVPGILDWSVRKMEERYDLLARVGVRDINSFNKLGDEKVREKLGLTEEEEDVVDTYMPRIVIVIDELADLMMLSSSSKEVEANIQRLAQKSRAVGIHVILATQRPSVDVITGVIKANLPCRIAFMVNSATDSRTILDRKGAEALLGQGDLLFKDPGRSDLQRLQGAFVSEEEVRRVVDFWREQGNPQYIEDLLNPNRAEAGDPREKDELYEKAVRLVLESRRGSTTFLQRMLGVGYTRASRLIELMEMDGLVGPHKGSVSRDVLYTLEEYEARLTDVEDDEHDDEEDGYDYDDAEEGEESDVQWQEQP